MTEARAWEELVDCFKGSAGEMPQLLQAIKKATNPVVPPELAKVDLDKIPPVPTAQGV